MATVVRTTRFTVEPARIDEMLAARAALIDRLRIDHPALTAARLSRLEDGTYVDVWHWASRDEMQRALEAGPSLAEAGAVFAVITVAGTEDAELIDER